MSLADFTADAIVTPDCTCFRCGTQRAIFNAHRAALGHTVKVCDGNEQRGTAYALLLAVLACRFAGLTPLEIAGVLGDSVLQVEVLEARIGGDIAGAQREAATASKH